MQEETCQGSNVVVQVVLFRSLFLRVAELVEVLKESRKVTKEVRCAVLTDNEGYRLSTRDSVMHQ